MHGAWCTPALTRFGRGSVHVLLFANHIPMQVPGGLHVVVVEQTRTPTPRNRQVIIARKVESDDFEFRAQFVCMPIV